MGTGSRADYNDQPYYIRRVLTEGAVNGSDRRAVFVGIEAYQPPPEAPSSAICSRRTTAAGLRTRRCSTGSRPTS